jgi:di/tricarboxylate transporter
VGDAHLTWEAWVTLFLLVLLLYGLARNLARPETILLGGLTVLLTLGLISNRFPDARAVAASFGNEGLLTVAVLFAVAEGLSVTGAIGLMTERLLGRPKTVAGAQVRMMLPVAGISAFLNNTPVVAMFMPVVNDWCKKTGVSPSKLFIPLSYAAIMGGCCTLIGTSTNLVVQGMLIDASKTTPSIRPMEMFTITWVGVPAMVVGMTYLLTVGRWLLPDRVPPSERLADARQYTVEMLVQPGSAIDGQTVEKAGLRQLPGAYLVEVERGGETIAAVGPEQVLRGGDRLIFVGIVSSVVDLQKIRGLMPATEQVYKLVEPRHNRVLLEAVVSNSCPLINKSIRDGQFRTRYEAAVIAVHRNGARIDKKIGDIVLQAGDTLLLEAHPRFQRRHQNSRDFFLVSTVEESRPVRHEKAWTAIAILVGMVALMACEGHRIFGTRTEPVSVLTVALLAAGLMVVTRCMSGEQARRSIDWSTLLAIGASFGIGRAMETTGLASSVAETLINIFRGMGPWGVLFGVYLVTLMFTHFVTHNASAVLAFPIAKAAALGLGVNFMPFAICIAMAASHGYATPLGYATHLMVYGPGGYRFGDFVRIGLPLDLLIMCVGVGLAPLFFPF